MEKNLINEVQRIYELMGVNMQLLEVGGNPWLVFLETLAQRGSMNEGKFFKILEEAFKPLKGEVSSEDINKIVKEIQDKVGLTADETATLKKLLKEDADFNKVIKESENYYDDLKKITRRNAPKNSENVLKMAGKVEKMSASDMAKYSRDLVSSAWRDPLSRLSTIYNGTKQTWSNWFDGIDKLYGEEWLLHNADEVYDRIDDKLNEYLQSQVEKKFLSVEEAKQIFNDISTEIRTNSTIKEKVDDMISSGRNANRTKRTRTVKYGDEPWGVDESIKYKNNLIDWKKPPSIENLKTGILDDAEPYIPIRPEGDDGVFKPEDEFKTLDVGYLKKYSAFFINFINPWFNMWRTQIENLLEVVWPNKFYKDFDKRKLEFLEASKRSFNEFISSNKGAKDNFTLIASYREMMNKLLKFPKNSDIMINDAIGSVYDTIWDDFVAFGQKQFADDPDKLRDFQSFCADVQTRNLGNRTACLDDLLETAKNKGNEIVDIKTKAKTAFQSTFENVKKGAVPALWDIISKNDFSKRVIAFAFTGKFTTPREFMISMSKESRSVVRRVVKDGAIVKTSAASTRTAAIAFAKAMLIGTVITTALAAIGEFILTMNGMSGGFDRPWNFFKTNENDPFYVTWGKGLANLFTGYFCYDLVKGIKLDDIFQGWMSGQKPEDRFEWDDQVQKFLPYGPAQEILYGFFVRPTFLIEPNNLTPEEIKEITTFPKREDMPDRGGDTSWSLNVAMNLTSPPVLRSPDNKFSEACGAQMASNLRWNSSENVKNISGVDTHSIWVEDMIKNKQYQIVINPNWKEEDKSFLFWLDGNKNRSINEMASEFTTSFKTSLKKYCDGLVKFNQKRDVLCSKLDKTDIFEQSSETNNLKPNKKIEINLEDSIYKRNNLIMENTPRTKFGEDNFKHWKDTFVFKSEDEKNPGQFKQVKINMEDVMDRINHYRKKYDEDDAFVRAVLDTHDNVVKVMYTKDLANISESARPRGLALLLREDRGELEIFSVSRPANGNWFLVKGDYSPSQMANMDLEKKEPQDKETKKITKPEEDLKKKEQESIIVLKRNEKDGMDGLPSKVKQKLKEKIRKGWTTEEPPSFLIDHYTESEINSVFNDPIQIYKLEPSNSFFNILTKNSPRVSPKRGFCRSLYNASKGQEMGERQRKTINHILTKCKAKFSYKFGVASF